MSGRKGAKGNVRIGNLRCEGGWANSAQAGPVLLGRLCWRFGLLKRLPPPRMPKKTVHCGAPSSCELPKLNLCKSSSPPSDRTIADWPIRSSIASPASARTSPRSRCTTTTRSGSSRCSRASSWASNAMKSSATQWLKSLAAPSSRFAPGRPTSLAGCRDWRSASRIGPNRRWRCCGRSAMGK